jgi:uroporphyrinogen decarboxylase
VSASGGFVVGVDWRMLLYWLWSRTGEDRAIQGNIEPAALLAHWRELKPRVDDVLAQAGGRPGHIFNLGHGIFPDTQPDTVRRLVDYVHEKTAT